MLPVNLGLCKVEFILILLLTYGNYQYYTVIYV